MNEPRRLTHDILIDRLKRRIDDAGVTRLARAYLNAGIMDGGVVVDRHLGTPQGGGAGDGVSQKTPLLNSEWVIYRHIERPGRVN